MREKSFKKERWAAVSRKYSIFLVLVALFLVCSIINPNFLTWTNLTNISRQLAVTTILAFGETILIVCGLLDLSSGSVIALAGTLSVAAYKSSENLLLAFLVGVVLAVACNFLNGVMVTTFKAPAFIATLSMQTMARGAALLYTSGQNIYQLGDYIVFGQGSIGPVPTPVIFLLLIFLVTWYLLSNTRFGRSLYAIGGNESAAIASGIAVNRVKMWAYLVNGIFVGIAAVLFMSRVNTGLPNGAQGYEFEALTATVIGGTSMSGGIGTAGGTLIGAFIVGFLNNIMNLTNVDSYLQQIVRGLIIALAVIYDIFAKTNRTKRRLGNIEDQKQIK